MKKIMKNLNKLNRFNLKIFTNYNKIIRIIKIKVVNKIIKIFKKKLILQKNYLIYLYLDRTN
jgi:hypothetical protein